MMLEPAKILGYLSDAASFGDAIYPKTTANSPQWVVSFEDFASGGLSSHMTREILLNYSFNHEDVDYGSSAIPLLCCLRSVLYDSDKQRTPLLCMRAMLDPNGSLSPYPERTAWIPTQMLDASAYHGAELCVCDYDAYRAHEAAMLSLPSDGTWSATVERALDLFDSVNGLTPEALAQTSATLDASSCVLSIWERPDDLRKAHEVLSAIKGILESDDTSTEALLESVSLGSMLNDMQGPRGDEAQKAIMGEELPDDAYIAPKLLCGTPDHLPPFGQREREALVSIARKRPGGLKAVCTPKGTSSRPLAVSAMANLLTNYALRGELAPTMVCVGNESELTKIVDLFANRPLTGQMALNSRWLPRISTSNAHNTERTERRTLGPLQALCLMHGADGISYLESSHCMRQPLGHIDGGDIAEYGDEWYIPKASIYFLDCVSRFMGLRVQSVARAGAILSDTLRRIDQDRCELIDAYAGVCNASELMKQRDDLVARIGRLRRGHTVCRERLKFWERLGLDNQPRRTLLGKSPQDQSSLISRHMQRGEELAEGKVLLEDVCEAYRKEILRIETSIDRLRGASANLTRRIKAAEVYGKKCAEIIARLSDACGLDADKTALLEASIDGRTVEVSIEHLNEVLDLVIRPAEFWLSIHIYESRWLSAGQRRKLNSSRAHKEGTRPVWKDWAALCPFQLVPTDIAVGVISQLVGKDMESIGLSVVLDADELDLPRGTAVAACSDRMVVCGSTATLGALPLRHQAFDEIRVRATMGDGAWNELNAQGLSVSSQTSFYEFVQNNSHDTAISLCDTHESYGELDDLRTDLFPDERLRTCRIPANSADDNDYALNDIVPSISYVLVPDSSWEQRGCSRQNRAEVQALSRWMANHLDDMLARFKRYDRSPIVLVSPFCAQTSLLRTYAESLSRVVRHRIEVRTLCELREDTWPVVVLCMTCGPDAFDGLGHADAKNVLSLCAAASQYALVMFCGGAWMRSHSDVAKAALKHATRVGRLFSAPRKRRYSPKGDGAAGRGELGLRVKPLSISALLNDLRIRNEIDAIPVAAEVNKALMKAGLIEKTKDHEGRTCWRPTAAGREIGIIAKKDHYGHPFCVYTQDSVPVVTSIVETML